ncbi:diaminopimelate decarboxylase [Roseimicrobium sp. ORNL1]|uniref:diaminopimelate decarboxylase n=1 Tax=Roseimicrobium sp. ORNL1 TaxID=2711231 RepID=UPI0013E19268|nr:diaminopimelate decarboxylase [Roseimicrobium sp. ORNL1]QIF02992.1 diaminopimelate decarboxylase [Roseimicrobium sp. ORNL1]
MTLNPELLRKLAQTAGTPFWLYDAATLRQRIADIKFITDSPGVQARFAMKACPATKILQEMQKAGIWIDAVSGNEVLRALAAGYQGGQEPAQVALTCDVFRDNALDVVLKHGVLPNIGSPGQIQDLVKAGYKGGISVRVNPGFGHGHVNACDTGGPSSKHGIWFEDFAEINKAAQAAGFPIHMLHAHIGSGPQFDELVDNLTQLAEEFASFLPQLPDLRSVSLGGGIPHNYRDQHAKVPLERLKKLFADCRERLVAAEGRPIGLEIEPGRYYVAPTCILVAQVTDVKRTRDNAKGAGATFAMVDAGFVDLVRPAMYGSYHRITVLPHDGAERPEVPIVVAGPLCESGDVFTRDDQELLQPRDLPQPEAGDLLVLHDAGAYGYAMSSNYNSIGRAPQLWLEEDGSVQMISRREKLEDLLKAECSEKVAV